MPTRDPDLLQAIAAAAQFSQDDRMAEAVQADSRALARVAVLRTAHGEIGDSIEATTSLLDLLEAGLLVHKAGMLFEIDQLTPMANQLAAARALIDPGLQRDRPQWLPAHVSWLFEDARLLRQTRQLSQAQAQAQACVSLLEQQPDVGLDPALLPRARSLLGTALAMGGQAEGAITQLQLALQDADRLMQRMHPCDQGRLLTNLGAALWAQGALDEGIQCSRQALLIFEGLVLAGRSHMNIDIARVCMNLGGLLVSSGRLDEAVKCLHRSWLGYRRMVRMAGPLQGTDRLLASSAMAEMNYGYALYKAGMVQAAERRIQHALVRQAAHLTHQPWLAEDLARIRVNRAHLLAQGGRHALAAKAYSCGLAEFQALIRSGRASLRADEANAMLGLGRALVAQGKLPEAGACLREALQTLSKLIQAGQLQNARAWMQGWQAHVQALLQRPATHRRQPGAEPASARRSRGIQPLLATGLQLACECLGGAPRAGLARGPEPLRDLLEGLDQLSRWQAQPIAADGRDQEVLAISRAFYQHLLACNADLLGDASPVWLAAHRDELAALTERLCQFAHALPDGSQLMADWFLHTHGLRAQRSALVDGSTDDVAALRAMFAELRRIEEAMLEEWRHAPPGAADPGGSGRHVEAAAAGAPLNMGQAATQTFHLAEVRAAEWLSLRQRCDVLHQRLVQDGLLPPALRLESAKLAEAMAPSTVLLMLAPLPNQAQLLISLRKPRAGGARAAHLVAEAPAQQAHFSCRTLNDLARQALCTDARGAGLRGAATELPTPAPVLVGLHPDMSLDRFALEAFSARAMATVQPVLAALAEQGASDFALVPSGELHLLPWSFALSSTMPASCRLTVYPDCAAFARHGTMPTPTPPGDIARWAVAAHPGADPQRLLPWAAVELHLSRQLWQADGITMQTLDAEHPRADNINAFLGIGHGVAPLNSLANAGLLTSDQSILSAHHLVNVKTCRRVLLSCCVLGQIDTVAGEALGFLSACFGHQTEFGVGWLTEVPDAEACLFSVSFQFALRAAAKLQSGNSSAWSQVFNRTREIIAAGHWPEGFEPWLTGALPAALAASAEFGSLASTEHNLSVPPPMLRRLMPWAVALGRG